VVSHTPEVVDLMVSLEEEAAALYLAFSQRFASQPDLAVLWSELAEDERAHARLVRDIERGVLNGEIPAGMIQVASEPIKRLLETIRRQRAEFERGALSVAEAFAVTVELETSEVNEALPRLAAAARPYLPSLPDEETMPHLGRLVRVVDRLGDREVTAVLRTLVRLVERRCGAPPKILIVDDEVDMRETCVRIFKRDGYECVAVNDGHEALTILDRERPDLILTDLRMPRMDGLAFLRHVRRLPAPPPVVVLTAYVSEGSVREALAVGAAACLPKPFTPQKLREVVEPLLQIPHSRPPPAGPVTMGEPS